MSLLLLLAAGGEGASTPPPEPEQPTPIVEVAFGYTWRDAAPQWTDVTQYVDKVVGLSFDQGRGDELEDIRAGTCSLTLDNSTRRFDPSYTAGPYYGQLKPVVPLRVTFTWDNVTYPLFRGYVEGWPQVSSVGNRVSPCAITASDAVELLSQADYSGGVWTLDDPILGRLDAGNRLGGDDASVGAQLSGTRFDLILDLVGWPEELRDIDEGDSYLAAALLDGSPAAALSKIATAEDGWWHVDPEGKVVFRARYADRHVERMAESQATFTDADFSMPYAGLRYNYDRRFVFNDVIRGRTDGVDQQVTDEASIDDYFRRQDSRTDLPFDTDSAAAAIASRFLFRHAEPALRPEPLIVDPGNNRDALFPQVLGRWLLDRITLERTPQEIGDPITGDYRIEGRTLTYSNGRWSVTWPLSPVDDSPWWTLDDDVLGLLDSGNLVGA